MSIKQINCAKMTIKPFPIAIVISRFNTAITERLLDSALARLKQFNFKEDLITVIHVPGAVELPLVCKKLAQNKSVNAIIALGAVIRGETSHYDYVCQMASDGCLAVSQQYELPVIFGVLTTENSQQAMARSGGEHSDKGSESIDVAIEMVQVMEQLSLPID